MQLRPELKSAQFRDSSPLTDARLQLPSNVRHIAATQRSVTLSRTLIPINAADGADRAITYFIGSKYCRPRAEVHLLNVQRLSMKGDFALDAALDIERRAKLAIGIEVLNDARAWLDAEGIRCTALVLFGKPADTIVDYGREHAIDAIIMETNELASLKRLFRGSVSAKVQRLASADVILVSRTKPNNAASRPLAR